MVDTVLCVVDVEVSHAICTWRDGVASIKIGPLNPKQQPGRTDTPFGAQHSGDNVVTVIVSGKLQLISGVGRLSGVCCRV